MQYVGRVISTACAFILVSACACGGVATFEDGVWQSVGSGHILQIHNGESKRYEVTAISCIDPTREFVVSSPFVGIVGIPLYQSPFVDERGQFLIRRSVLGPRDYYERLPEVPDSCLGGGRVTDPVYNADVFWHILAENYAFFDLYGVNWDTQRQTVLDVGGFNDEQLFTHLAATLAPLLDAHVFFIGDDNFFAPAERWQFGSTEKENELDTIILENYLVEDAFTQVVYGTEENAVNNELFFGTLADGTAYVTIKSMRLFDARNQEGDYDIELTAIAETFRQLELYFADANSIIIDLRYNGGGSPLYALKIADWLSDVDGPGINERIYSTNSDHESVINTYAYPLTGNLTRHFDRVYILTEGGTASASEWLALQLAPATHVVRVGGVSQGAFSTVLMRILPNGWRIGLSNHDVRSASGESFEGVGLSPDILAPLTELSFTEGQDPALDAILANNAVLDL